MVKHNTHSASGLSLNKICTLGYRYTDFLLRLVTVYGQGEGSRYMDKTADSDKETKRQYTETLHCVI